MAEDILPFRARESPFVPHWQIRHPDDNRIIAECMSKADADFIAAACTKYRDLLKSIKISDDEA